MLFLDSRYNFFIAMFGRGEISKKYFMQAMLDRNDIMIREIYENEDCLKVVFDGEDTGRVTVYNFSGLEDSVPLIPEIKYTLSSYLNRLDYILYFMDSVDGISEFDRRFVSVLNEYEANVMCVINKAHHQEVSKALLYTLQGDLGTPVYHCNCMNRPDVMEVTATLELYAKEEIEFDCLRDFFRQGTKKILFILPISIASHWKNKHERYYDLIKSLAESDGVAICVNKSQAKEYLENTTFQLDAVVAGGKVLLNVQDICRFLEQ